MQNLINRSYSKPIKSSNSTMKNFNNNSIRDNKNIKPNSNNNHSIKNQNPIESAQTFGVIQDIRFKNVSRDKLKIVVPNTNVENTNKNRGQNNQTCPKSAPVVTTAPIPNPIVQQANAKSKVVETNIDELPKISNKFSSVQENKLLNEKILLAREAEQKAVMKLTLGIQNRLQMKSEPIKNHQPKSVPSTPVSEGSTTKAFNKSTASNSQPILPKQSSLSERLVKAQKSTYVIATEKKTESDKINNVSYYFVYLIT